MISILINLEELSQDILKGVYDCEVYHVGKTGDGGIDLIVLESDEPRLWKGYLLISIDGSKAEVPNNRKTGKHFYLYSEVEHIFVSENELVKHLREMGTKQLVLAIFDRGYPFIEFIDFLETDGIHYLIRLSSNDYKAERKQMTTSF